MKGRTIHTQTPDLGYHKPSRLTSYLFNKRNYSSTWHSGSKDLLARNQSARWFKFLSGKVHKLACSTGSHCLATKFLGNHGNRKPQYSNVWARNTTVSFNHGFSQFYQNYRGVWLVFLYYSFDRL